MVLTFSEKWDYLSAGGHDTANENTKMSFIREGPVNDNAGSLNIVKLEFCQKKVS